MLVGCLLIGLGGDRRGGLGVVVVGGLLFGGLSYLCLFSPSWQIAGLSNPASDNTIENELFFRQLEQTSIAIVTEKPSRPPFFLVCDYKHYPFQELPKGTKFSDPSTISWPALTFWGFPSLMIDPVHLDSARDRLILGRFCTWSAGKGVNGNRKYIRCVHVGKRSAESSRRRSFRT